MNKLKPFDQTAKTNCDKLELNYKSICGSMDRVFICDAENLEFDSY